MIAYLKGGIIQKNQKSAIILINGVGYEVFLSAKNLTELALGAEVEFFIYSHIKEDAFDLYGFGNLEELDFFKKIVSVSGVGPKTALNVLALAAVSDLKKAIASEDPKFLQQVSGIGKKTAERIVMELKEKFINDLSDFPSAVSDQRQVIDALVSLGYKEVEVREVVNKVAGQPGELGEKIKQALKMIN